MPEDLEAPPVFVSLSVEARVSPGATYYDAVREAIALAQRLHAEIEFTHNDVSIVLRWDDDPEVVVRAWPVIARQQRHARRKEAGDA